MSLLKILQDLSPHKGTANTPAAYFLHAWIPTSEWWVWLSCDIIAAMSRIAKILLASWLWFPSPLCTKQTATWNLIWGNYSVLAYLYIVTTQIYYCIENINKIDKILITPLLSICMLNVYLACFLESVGKKNRGMGGWTCETDKLRSTAH